MRGGKARVAARAPLNGAPEQNSISMEIFMKIALFKAEGRKISRTTKESRLLI
jgi:hypothetical protein